MPPAFGVLDLRGGRGRWFGGIGAAAPPHDAGVGLRGGHPDGRAQTPGGRRIRARSSSYKLRGGARVRIHRAFRRMRIGVGTQLRGRSVGHSPKYTESTMATQMAGPSDAAAIGDRHMDVCGGGLVVEGGIALDDSFGGCSRVLCSRGCRFPPLALRGGRTRRGFGLSGNRRSGGIRRLPAPRTGSEVLPIGLMTLLTAVADGDIDAFGAALTQIQEIDRPWFAPCRGTSRLV